MTSGKMMFLGNKSRWITTTNKQAKFGMISRLSSRVGNPTSTIICLFNFLIQLAFFLSLFLSDVWQDDVSWKQIDMDYLGNTDKQTIEIWNNRTIKLSRRKSYIDNGTWLFNFLIAKTFVMRAILNESSRAVYGSMDRDITLLNTYHTFRS